MPKKQKPMTDKEYVQTGGVRCPYCRSTNVEGQSIDVDAGEATQEMGCNDCNAEWVDCYKLVGYMAGS